MQFDQARIAIRERSWADNLDLALHVVRQHFVPLLGYALLAIVPLVALNHGLLNLLSPVDFADDFWSTRTVTLTVMLVMIEAPLGTSLVTLYLGQALFDEKPRPRQILADFARSLPQLLLLQVLLRAILIGFIVTWVFPYAVWPYLNEVILLERNPMMSRRGAMSTLSRSSVLHQGNSGDYLARGLITLFLAPLLMTGVDVSADFVLGTLLGYQPGYLGKEMQFQFVLWLVTVYFAVVRFLCYLDQRIRQEGWEVELFLRARAGPAGKAAPMNLMQRDRTLVPLVRWLAAILVLAGWLLPAVCFAAPASQAANAEETVQKAFETGNYPWYDAEQDTLKPITLIPPRPPSPAWKFLAKALSWVGWALLALLLLAILVMLYLAVRARQALAKTTVSPAAATAASVDQIEALPFLNDRSRDDLLGEARRHYEAGNYGEAIIYLFSYQLIALDRSSLIHLTKGKTNRQYLREARKRPPLAQLLESSMVTFEGVFFGGRVLDRAAFEACWGRLPEFNALLAQEPT